MNPPFADLLARFRAAGQEHVFAFWDTLSESQRTSLAHQAASIDLEEIARLVETLVRRPESSALDLEGLEPAPYLPHPSQGGDADHWKAAREEGEAALRAGRVAAFVVAGGQGTRLGYDGPKGTFPATPVRRWPLFGVFAEKIRAASLRYGARIPWFIMTSHQNHQATVEFFQHHHFFGLDPADVRFFTQGRMPAVGFDGRILMESKADIALSPDGHGGSLRALVRSGAVQEMEARGIDILSYFQVDNPLVRVIDPAFIGFHLGSGAEMSSKTIPKAYPKEKVGHFCLQQGRHLVIEYSDMPDTLTEMTEPDGRLRFRAGSIAIHILGREFVARTGGSDTRCALPFHRAEKKVRTIDADGQAVDPSQPNGIKFEMFVFDAIPFARQPVIVETLRSEDFSPVKNATGLDSPQTSIDDQLRLWARWVRAAGGEIPTDHTGLPPFPFEVSPLFADTEEAFVGQCRSMGQAPRPVAGQVFGP